MSFLAQHVKVTCLCVMDKPRSATFNNLQNVRFGGGSKVLYSHARIALLAKAMSAGGKAKKVPQHMAEGLGLGSSTEGIRDQNKGWIYKRSNMRKGNGGSGGGVDGRFGDGHGELLACMLFLT